MASSTPQKQQQPSQEIDLENILSTLTLDEKCTLVSGASIWRTHGIGGKNIPVLKVSDGPNGVRGDGGVASSSFPVGICMASSWNRKLLERVGNACAIEAKQKGVSVVLGPTMNLHRTALGGRNFECYSECPILSGELGASFTIGVQRENIGACPKHYVCNDSEFERHTISVEIDKRTLHELYLKPFEMVIEKAKPWTIMASYNKINGIYACSHDHLVNDVLKRRFGFDGLVISDWFAAKETIPNALGGLDLEMPGPSRVWGKKLIKAVQDGDVPEANINDKVRRLLRLFKRTGKFENPNEKKEEGIDLPITRNVAHDVASEGMVLLKNSNNILPLNKNSVKKIAIIGPNLLDFRIMGGGSSSLKSHAIKAPLASLRKKFGSSVQISDFKGCTTYKYAPPIDRKYLKPSENSEGTGLVLEMFKRDERKGLTQIGASKTTSRGIVYITSGGYSAGAKSVPDVATLSGIFTPDIDGIYEFGINATGKTKLFINGELVIDNWNGALPNGDAFFARSTPEKRGKIHLSGNTSYNLKINFENDPLFQAMIPGIMYGVLPPEPFDLVDEAVDFIQKENIDYAILMTGTSDDWETEGNDRRTLSLPGRQDELIYKVAKACKNTIVVNNSGSPISMPWKNNVGAILQTWFPGEEYGDVLADILLGNVNPSGKLPITFPNTLEETPAFTNYPGEFGKVKYGEGLYIGYRWYTSKALMPLYPFGYGLSYTTFELSNISVNNNTLHNSNISAEMKQQMMVIQFDIKNLGQMDGKEVVQVYVEHVNSRVQRPVYELKTFKKVFVPAGKKMAKEQIRINANDAFSYYDPLREEWVVDNGEYVLHLGTSSVDLKLRTTIFIVGGESGSSRM